MFKSIYQLIWRQSWLGLKFKKTVYKKLCRLGEIPDAPFETDFFGLRYQGNLSNGIEFALYYYGAFEKPLLFFLRDSLLALNTEKDAVNDSVFCDVGANIGQHSLFMSRYAGQVHSFEPLVSVSQRLQQHIELNNINNIAVHDIGLSDENGSLPFYAPSGTNQGVGSFDASSTARGNKVIGELAISRGDDFFAKQGIGRVDLMKIDVEGFERKALQGMKQILNQQRPLIVCEVSYGEPLSFRSRQDFLDTLPPDYGVYAFDTRKADGTTARRRGAKAKRTGSYQLLELQQWRSKDQDDLVAVPNELLGTIPMKNA